MQVYIIYIYTFFVWFFSSFAFFNSFQYECQRVKVLTSSIVLLQMHAQCSVGVRLGRGSSVALASMWCVSMS